MNDVSPLKRHGILMDVTKQNYYLKLRLKKAEGLGTGDESCTGVILAGHFLLTSADTGKVSAEAVGCIV